MPVIATDSQLTELIARQMPLLDVLGIEAIRATREEVVLQGSWDAALCTAGGVLHGGFLMALADAAAATVATLNLPSGAVTTTIEAKTNFLRAVREGVVWATATTLHVGATTIVVQTDLVRDDGRLVARTTQTQAVRAAA
jgi:1,4-dihydroxy-2-naphthoyl-CoA hydrolase